MLRSSLTEKSAEAATAWSTKEPRNASNSGSSNITFKLTAIEELTYIKVLIYRLNNKNINHNVKVLTYTEGLSSGWVYSSGGFEKK